MINEDITMSPARKMSANSSATRFNQSKPEDDVFYKHVRARFLQQSACYLGADLSDSRVQSLCFSDSISYTTGNKTTG